MATRLYHPSAVVPPPFSPAVDAAWEVSAGIFFRTMCSTVKSGSAMTTFSYTDAVNTDQDICFVQFHTHPLKAGQTITGTQNITGSVRCAERIAGNNLFRTVGIRVMNGTTVQKTMLVPTRGTVEIATTLTSAAKTNASAATNYTTVVGDYLVIELGLGGDPANSGGADHDGDIRLGDGAASDLDFTDLDTGDDNGWVELTDTLTFEAPKISNEIPLRTKPSKTKSSLDIIDLATSTLLPVGELPNILIELSERTKPKKTRLHRDIINLLNTTLFIPPADAETVLRLPTFDKKKPSKRFRRDEVIANLLGTTLEPAVAPRSKNLTLRLKKLKYRSVDVIPNLLNVLYTEEVTPRTKVLLKKLRRSRVKFDDTIINLLSNTLTPVQVDEPFKIVEISLGPKRKRFAIHRDQINLLLTTLSDIPFVHLDLSSKLKSKQYKSSKDETNELITTLANGNPLVAVELALRLKVKQAKITRDQANILLTTLSSTFPNVFSLESSPKRIRFRPSESFNNLLDTILTTVEEFPFPGNLQDPVFRRKFKKKLDSIIDRMVEVGIDEPFVNQDLSVKTRKSKAKDSEERTNSNLLFAPVFNFIQIELDKIKKVAKTKNDLDVPININLVPLEYPFVQLPFDKSKKQAKKRESLDNFILPVIEDPGFPAPRQELDRYKGKIKYKKVWDIINSTLYFQPVPPPEKPVGTYEEYRFNINKRLAKLKKNKHNQELFNVTLSPLAGLRPPGNLTNYLRRYLNDRDGLDQDTPGTPHNLNTEVSIDKKLTNYFRRYLNDKTTEE